MLGKENYMKHFDSQHKLAFYGDRLANQYVPDSNLHEDKGLPEVGDGRGLYSQRLSYMEWHRQSCARLAYNELTEQNPNQIFNLLIGSLRFPVLSILFGTVYFFASIKRVRVLFQNNGIKAAKESVYTKLKCVSMTGLRLVGLASMTYIAYQNYKEELPQWVGDLIKKL